MHRPFDIRPALAATLLAFALGLVPTDVAAGAFYLPGHGVRPAGRAGASVASSGGNLNAIWHNPANLALLEERTLTVDTAVIGSFSTFQRAPRTKENGEVERYPAVSNEALPVPDPQVLIGGPTGLEDVSWAAGLWAPYSGYQRYPEEGPQRYSLIDKSGSVLAYLGASVGWQVTDSLRIGAGFQNVVADLELVSKVSGYSGLYGRPEDKDLDVLVRLNAKDLFAPTGNLGVWYAISESVQAAASVQLPTRIADKNAKVDVRRGSHPSFDEVEQEGNAVSAGMTLPVMVRAALRYQAPSFDLELTGVYEGWSVVDRLVLDPQGVRITEVPGVGEVPLEPIPVERDWRDSVSVRLGGDYELSEAVTVRGGYAFETSAIPAEYHDVLALDAPKHLFSGGFTHRWDRISLDGSVAYYLYHTREVSNSKIRQIAPMDPDDEHATVVGNGTYRIGHLVVGAGVNWKY